MDLEMGRAGAGDARPRALALLPADLQVKGPVFRKLVSTAGGRGRRK